MKIKNIWLVNKYAMPPQYESRLRTIKFAHYLQEMGYKVTIFGSSVMHNMNIDLINDGSRYVERQYDDLHFIHIKGCHYKKTAGIKRVFGGIQFIYRLISISKRFKLPDLIIAPANSLISTPLVDFAKKNGIKFIAETLDLWPDNFVDFGLIGKNNPITKYLFWVAKRGYAKSDAIVFSPKGCYRYFQNKGWDTDHGGPIDLKKVHYINNGVDLNDFNRWKEEYTLNDCDLSSNKKKVIYLGSIRLVNNVIQLVKAAELLKKRNDVEFLIYGDGDDRVSLMKYCEEHHLSNVKFKDKWIDPKYVPYVLSHSYLNILNYISSDFAKNGISSSKMFQYMASGKPIVCNIDILFCPITENKIGVAHKMENAQDYANAISCILDLSESDYNAMCERTRETAKEYDYPYLAKQMADVIESL